MSVPLSYLPGVVIACNHIVREQVTPVYLPVGWGDQSSTVTPDQAQQFLDSIQPVLEASARARGDIFAVY